MAASQYHLNADGSFIIEDFQHAKILPIFSWGGGFIRHSHVGILCQPGAGHSLIGIESKDRAILEFQPANKAYRLASTQGFRTFLKISGGKSLKFYEPFANHIQSPFKSRPHGHTKHDLTIEEVNATLGIKTTINYFTVPEEPYAAWCAGCASKIFQRTMCPLNALMDYLSSILMG